MLSSEGAAATGEMALWAEGFFVKGYFLISAVDGEPLEEAVLELVNGQLFNGFLQLSFAVAEDPFFAEEATLYFEHTNFSFDSDRGGPGKLDHLLRWLRPESERMRSHGKTKEFLRLSLKRRWRWKRFEANAP